MADKLKLTGALLDKLTKAVLYCFYKEAKWLNLRNELYERIRKGNTTEDRED